jgi:hypothetical protein
MGIREEQFIVNYLRFQLKVPDECIGGYLFKMLDEEFGFLMMVRKGFEPLVRILRFLRIRV